MFRNVFACICNTSNNGGDRTQPCKTSTVVKNQSECLPSTLTALMVSQ